MTMVYDPDVYDAQGRLGQLGYNIGTPDGRDGPRTRAAIAAFQRDHGLIADGRMGPKTRASLQVAHLPSSFGDLEVGALLERAKAAIAGTMSSFATAASATQKCLLETKPKPRRRNVYCVPTNNRTKGKFGGPEARAINDDYGTDVDWDELSSLEGGQHTDAYVPWWPDPDTPLTKGADRGKTAGSSSSGVTVGTGVDLGQGYPDDMAAEMIAGGVPAKTVETLVPYMGKRRQDACSFLRDHPLRLTREEVTAIDNWAKRKHLAAAKSSFNATVDSLNADGAVPPRPRFEELTSAQQTVLLSRTYQQGTGMPTKGISAPFYGDAVNGRWDEAADRLDAMEDKAGWARNRTGKEADYLRSHP